MPKLEQVTKGLECWSRMAVRCDKDCPYKPDEEREMIVGECDIQQLCKDASEVLNEAQELLCNYGEVICYATGGKLSKPTYAVSVIEDEIREHFCDNCDYADEIDEIEARHWVSVKDRLPEVRHAVLGYTPFYKNIWAVTMHEDECWYFWYSGTSKYDPDWYGPITYWMPMPEPPKEEEDNG